MDNHIDTLLAHINNYLYELRSAGKVDFRAAVQQDCSAALSAIVKEVREKDAANDALKLEIEELKADAKCSDESDG